MEGLRRGDLSPLQLVYDGPGQEGGEQLLRLLLLALVVGHPLVVDLGVLGGQIQSDNVSTDQDLEKCPNSRL